MVIYRLDGMTQKPSPSFMVLQNPGITRRTEHNSCPEQRASAKAPPFPSWENSISPQVVQQAHRLLPEEIKYSNKQNDAFQSCMKGNSVNKNYTMSPGTCP